MLLLLLVLVFMCIAFGFLHLARVARPKGGSEIFVRNFIRQIVSLKYVQVRGHSLAYNDGFDR